MSKTVLRRLLSYVRPYTGYVLGALVSAVINVSLTLYGPILIGRAVDKIVSQGAVDFAGDRKSVV